MANSLLRRRTILLTTAASFILIGWLAKWFTMPTPTSAQWIYNVGMIAAAALAGAGIARRAVQELLARRLGIEVLVTIAVTGALIIGEYWEAAAVTFLFVLGSALEAATLGRTRNAVEKLLDLAPNTAIVVRNGQQVEVDAYDVGPGEEVLIKPGGRIPVDGEVTAGHCAIDESSITGESAPAEKTPGSKVFAGTTLAGGTSGLLHVRATGIGDDTTLARIIERVEEAQEAKAPAQRAMERFATWYTPSVVVLALITFALTRNIETALTLLVIACPGALVISMPVTFVAGIGRAANRGILVKGGQYLEAAGKLDTIAFDKTGTLTAGRPELIAHPSISPHHADTDVLRWAAIAETGSEHPLAMPILAAARAQNIDLPAHADETSTEPGRGVMATWQGRKITVGSPRFLASNVEALSAAERASLTATLEEHANSGRTTVLIALDGEIIGFLAIADRIRTTAARALTDLKNLGVTNTVMLTGDDERVATAVAAELGIADVRAGLLPEDKLSVISDLTNRGHTTAMIGDGVNDAPALAAADVGLAMGAGGTAVAVETADVALMTDDLSRVAELIYLARRTRAVLFQNVFIALATVFLLIAGVLFAGTTMAVGMLVHELSVLVVVANAVRLLRARTQPRKWLRLQNESAREAHLAPAPNRAGAPWGSRASLPDVRTPTGSR